MIFTASIFFRRFIRALAPGALLLLAAGCATKPFPEQNASARPLTGQVYYVGPKRSFVGEFTARVSATDFQLDVSKGPGLSLFSVRESGGTLARVEAPGGRHWQGNPRRFTPGPVRGWVALGDVLAGRTPAGARVSGTAAPGGKLTAEFPESRERFVFQFSR